MPRTHARGTECGTERLEGDGYRADSVALGQFHGNVHAGMPRTHARATGDATRRCEGDTPPAVRQDSLENEASCAANLVGILVANLVGQQSSRFLLYFWLRLLGLSGTGSRPLPPLHLRLQQRRPLHPSEKRSKHPAFPQLAKSGVQLQILQHARATSCAPKASPLERFATRVVTSASRGWSPSRHGTFVGTDRPASRCEPHTPHP